MNTHGNTHDFVVDRVSAVSYTHLDVYKRQYYNSHNWKIDPDDKYEKCVIKKGGKVIKNYGYMDSRQYNTAKNSYRYKSTVKFVKNTSANRKRI